jgi:hypothetical protein
MRSFDSNLGYGVEHRPVRVWGAARVAFYVPAVFAP